MCGRARVSAARMREGPVETLTRACMSTNTPEETNCHIVIICGNHEEYKMLPHEHSDIEIFWRASAVSESEEDEVGEKVQA